MLDKQMLETMPQGTRFATGAIKDDSDGLNMSNSGKLLRWVAIRGHGYLDWAIYCYFEDRDIDWVARNGDKVNDENNIQKLVPCDNEAFKHYRY